MAAYDYFTNQKQWESYLKDLVKSNDKALLRAIVLVYDNQTTEEKNKGESIEDNCVGFSKVDAYEMGKIAQKIKRGEELTKGELAKSRNKMQKYWKQLMIISKRNAEAKKLQEQQEFENKMAEEEYAEKIESAAEAELFKEHNEILRRCAEEGQQCSYGICDECILTTGFQMKLDL